MPGPDFPYNIHAVVRAGIINHQQLNVRIGLVHHRADGFLDKPALIMTQAYDGNRRERHHQPMFL
jgi:hypothetical protein